MTRVTGQKVEKKEKEKEETKEKEKEEKEEKKEEVKGNCCGTGGWRLRDEVLADLKRCFYQTEKHPSTLTLISHSLVLQSRL